MTGQRTYWHLEHLRRVPSEYDIGTAKLLYYDPERGFEVPTPAGTWQCRLQTASAFRVDTWDAFRDPRETTYARYVAMQKEKEAFVEGLLRSMEAADYDRRLSAEWIQKLDALLPVLRFPCHGLQMTAAFLGQTAPASSVVIGCLFQVADEIRRVERLAYRMRQLQEIDRAFGTNSRSAWQEGAWWQPLRRVLETLLVTYDFAEAFVAQNLVLEPIFDELVGYELGRLAERHGDPLLGKLLFSLAEDSAWHQDFSAALVRFAIEKNPQNQGLARGFVERWRTPVEEATRALGPLFDRRDDAWLGEIEARRGRLWQSAGLHGGALQ